MIIKNLASKEPGKKRHNRTSFSAEYLYFFNLLNCRRYDLIFNLDRLLRMYSLIGWSSRNLMFVKGVSSSSAALIPFKISRMRNCRSCEEKNRSSLSTCNGLRNWFFSFAEYDDQKLFFYYIMMS